LSYRPDFGRFSCSSWSGSQRSGKKLIICLMFIPGQPGRRTNTSGSTDSVTKDW
jgi:hypothetical protein